MKICHLLWEQGVASSNLAAPTIKSLVFPVFFKDFARFARRPPSPEISNFRPLDLFCLKQVQDEGQDENDRFIVMSR